MKIRIKSCIVKFKFSFFALIAFCNIIAGVKDGGLIIFSVFLHESAHLAAMIINRQIPSKISFSALGIKISLNGESFISYSQSISISLAGPLINLALGVILILLSYEQHFFTMINLTLGILHMLPIEPLDGGLALKAFLKGHIDKKRAETISIIISLLFLIPLAVIGFLILLKTKNNFSLLFLSVYLMLYLVLKKDSAIF